MRAATACWVGYSSSCIKVFTLDLLESPRGDGGEGEERGDVRPLQTPLNPPVKTSIQLGTSMERVTDPVTSEILGEWILGAWFFVAA